MGIIAKLFSSLFGGGRNVIAETAGVFRENAEAGAVRSAEYNQAALAQYAAEYAPRNNRTWFDSLVDGLNRLVRPVITLSVLGVIPATMMWPEEMAVAFAALALLPAGYWALVSIITSFYYGGRMQIKAQDFTKSINDAVARAPLMIENMRRLRNELTPGEAEDDSDDMAVELSTPEPDTENRAISEWREEQGQSQ